MKTKQQRLEYLAMQEKGLISEGYQKETYKDLAIFTNDKDGDIWLKVYSGTSTNPIVYVRSRYADRIRGKITDIKRSADIREYRKKDAKGNRKLSSHAAAAKAIRQELKKEFTGVSFSVRSDSFSMGDSVHISWTDGPKTEDVKKFTGKYQYGHFDGMTDMYESSNRRGDIPQSKYVQTSRHMSDEVENEITDYLQKHFAGCEGKTKNDFIPDYQAYLSTLIFREFNKKSYYQQPENKSEFVPFEDLLKEAEKTDVSNFELVQATHTKKGFDLWVITIKDRVSKEVFNILLKRAKELGGWYSSYNKDGAIPGFQFKDEWAALSFIDPSNPTPDKPEKKTTTNKQAEKWEKLSISYRKESDKKKQELEHASTNTPKQNREYNSKRVDADILEDAANIASGLADLYKNNEADKVLDALQPVKSKRHLFPFIPGHDSGGYYDSHRARESAYEKYGFSTVGIEGIENDEEAKEVFNILGSLIKPDPGKERKNKIKQLEDNFKFQKIAGFFPTPEELANEMVKNLNITNGQTILEPSAGLGHLAEAVKLSYPENTLKTLEIRSNLVDILKLKGFDSETGDFMEFSCKFDRVIMNPPFENGQDIDHVRHAYEILNEGGRVVSIMGAGAFQNSTKKHREFQEWVNERGADYYPLPEKSFSGAFKSTNVNTYLVIIDK